MLRRAATVITAGASLVAVGLLAAPSGVAAPAPCTKPAGAKLLASYDGARAWRVTIDGGPGAPDLRRFFACERGHAPFLFEHGDTGADSLTDVPAAAIRGRFLAYGRTRKFGLGTQRATLIVRDLRTHKSVYVRRAVSKKLELVSFHTVVVRRSGNVAWIASNIVGSEGESVFEVRKHDAGGAALLDSGTGVIPQSLRLTSGGVQWMALGGVVKHAPLR
jgi:hypothetical protein